VFKLAVIVLIVRNLSARVSFLFDALSNFEAASHGRPFPDGSVRYMSVEEVSRSCGILPESPLMGMLSCGAYLTPTQAVKCLGAGVHAAAARQVVVT